MADSILSASTGDATADRIMHAVVGIFETTFNGRLRSCYIDGSYADGTETARSDLDVTIVFKDRFTDDAERDRAARLADYSAALSSLELDIEVIDDAEVEAGVYPSLKGASRCLYGEDRRARMAILPMHTWTRERMHAAYWLLVTVFHRPPVVAPPLPYPDPADQFFGYARRTVRLPTGAEVPSTRDLIRVTGWIATALLAYRAGVYVAAKSECHRAYRAHIGDEWAPLVEDLYRRCRTAWGYLIPSGEEEQQELRALCARTLQFENHFLVIYRDYALAQLCADDTASLCRALWVLEHIVYCDEGVRHAVQALTEHNDGDVRRAAARSFAVFRQC